MLLVFKTPDLGRNISHFDLSFPSLHTLKLAARLKLWFDQNQDREGVTEGEHHGLTNHYRESTKLTSLQLASMGGGLVHNLNNLIFSA